MLCSSCDAQSNSYFSTDYFEDNFTMTAVDLAESKNSKCPTADQVFTYYSKDFYSLPKDEVFRIPKGNDSFLSIPVYFNTNEDYTDGHAFLNGTYFIYYDCQISNSNFLCYNDYIFFFDSMNLYAFDMNFNLLGKKTNVFPDTEPYGDLFDAAGIFFIDNKMFCMSLGHLDIDSEFCSFSFDGSSFTVGESQRISVSGVDFLNSVRWSHIHSYEKPIENVITRKGKDYLFFNGLYALFDQDSLTLSFDGLFFLGQTSAQIKADDFIFDAYYLSKGLKMQAFSDHLFGKGVSVANPYYLSIDETLFYSMVGTVSINSYLDFFSDGETLTVFHTLASTCPRYNTMPTF